MIFIIGAAALSGLAAGCWGNATPTAYFLLAVVLASVAFSAAAVAKGWKEDGVGGLLYRARHPLGTALAGDEAHDGMALARWWLLGVAITLAAVLTLKRPDAWDNLRRGRLPPAPPASSHP